MDSRSQMQGSGGTPSDADKLLNKHYDVGVHLHIICIV